MQGGAGPVKSFAFAVDDKYSVVVVVRGAHLVGKSRPLPVWLWAVDGYTRKDEGGEVCTFDSIYTIRSTILYLLLSSWITGDAEEKYLCFLSSANLSYRHEKNKWNLERKIRSSDWWKARIVYRGVRPGPLNEDTKG